MRKVIYGGATSLDGYLAGPDGEIDWLHFSKDVTKILADFWKNVDAVLIGRKSWSAAAELGGVGGYPGVQTYLFSRTMKASPSKKLVLVRENAGDFVRELKQQEGKDICLMGGGELAESLFEAGVIDEVGLNIHPVLLGAGIPVFRNPGRRLGLALLESRVLDGGCVLANYRVAH